MIDPGASFAERVAVLERRIAELERAAGRGPQTLALDSLTVGGDPVVTRESDTYTPTFGGGGITIGTGGTPDNSAHWVWEGGPNSGDAGTLEVWGQWRLGSSGFSVGTNPTIGLPPGFSITGINPFWVCGEASLVDQSTQTNNRIAGIQRAPSSSTSVEVVLPQPATLITATVPFTWAADDRCRYHFRVPCVRS